MDKNQVYFVTRMKKNAVYTVIEIKRKHNEKRKGNGTAR